MKPSGKTVKQLKKGYPAKSVAQLAREFQLKPAQVYRALGLETELWTGRINTMTGIIMCFLVLAAPLVIVRGIRDFADLPQRVFIQLTVVGLLLLWSVKTVVTKKLKFYPNSATVMVIAFLGWCLASLFWAHNLYEGFYAAGHWLACGLVFFIINSNITQDRWISRLLGCLAAVGTAIVVVGFAQYFFNITWVPFKTPLAATLANKNMAAHVVSMVLPLCAVSAVYCQKKILRYLSCIITFLCTCFLIIGQNRTSWLACAAVVVFMVIAVLRERKSADTLVRPSKKTAAVALLLLAVVALAMLMPGRPQQNIEKLTKRALSIGERLDTVGSRQTYNARLAIWRNSLAMVLERPVTGFGAGNYKVFYPSYNHKAVIDRAFNKEKQAYRVHNDYIQLAAELGLSGLGLFLGVLWAAGSMFWKLTRSEQPAGLRLLVTGITSGIVAFMVVAFFSFPLQRAIPPLLLFAYLGILAYLYNRHVLQGKHTVIHCPRLVGIIAFLVLLTTGYGLVRFNYRNIVSERFYLTALSMEKKGNSRGALAAGLKALEYNPYNRRILSCVGRAYVVLGQFDKGLGALSKVISAYPDHLNSLFIQGIAYANAGNTAKALQIFKQVLKVKPNSRDAQKIVNRLKTHGNVKILIK